MSVEVGQPRAGEPRVDRWAPLLLAAWVALNFAWTLPFGLVNDDAVWIYGASTAARQPRAIVIAPAFSGGFLRPLVQASFALGWALGGDRPWVHRLFNIVAHGVVVVLLWQVVRRLAGPGWLPLGAAAFFAVHPDSAQAVVWVSGRTEVLCALFYVAALAAQQSGRTGWSAALFALALLSKESAVSLPLVLVGIALLTDRDPAAAPADRSPAVKGAVVRLWPHAAVLAGYLLLRASTLREFAPRMFDFVGAPDWAFVREKVTLVGEYLLIPLPVHGFLRSFLLLGVGPALALRATRHSPSAQRVTVRVGIAWAAAALLPYLPWFTFLPWYTYLASMGTSLVFAGLTAAAAHAVRGRRGVALAGCTAALWLAASVVVLQTNNVRERRAGARTEAVVGALVQAHSPAVPGSVFVVHGLEGDALGVGEGLFGRPVLAFGLTEAVRLRVGDHFLDVVHGDRRAAGLHAFRRPAVLLQWNDDTGTFRRAWQSF